MVAAVGNMTTAEIIAEMEAESAPCGAVLSPAQLHGDRHVRALGPLEDLDHPLAGRSARPPAQTLQRSEQDGPARASADPAGGTASVRSR